MSVRVGILGYGKSGRFVHAAIAAAAGLEIAAVASRRANEVKADFPNAAIEASPEALCARGDVDVVVVATPDNLHAAHARLALEAGKHVVVEKPFTDTSAEARGLIDLARARGRVLSVYQNRRWDSDFLTLQKVIGEGALGEVMHYAARWDRYRPAARGDWHDADMRGELYGLGPHLVDQALVLFGAPDWLVADVYNQRGVARDSDGFEILMGKGRTRISLGVNLMAADNYKGCRVLGTQAAFFKHGLDPQEPQLAAGMAANDAKFGVENETFWGRVVDGAGGDVRVIASERGDWQAYYRGIAAAIESGAPSPVSAEDGARVIAILEAATESSETGRRINVPAFLAARGL
jgi:scyllo-inositol 2-dehydrogenase (NADP+)